MLLSVAVVVVVFAVVAVVVSFVVFGPDGFADLCLHHIGKIFPSSPSSSSPSVPLPTRTQTQGQRPALWARDPDSGQGT